MYQRVTVWTGDPVIAVIAEQRLVDEGFTEMADWVRSHRPNCGVPDVVKTAYDLLPHVQIDIPNGEFRDGLELGHGWVGRPLTDNEVLAEISGRVCYHSFGDAAGRKTNKSYLEHIFSMDPLHSSILYHCRMSFFFAGVSRKFSHQFIRNYVGSDRDESGSPSQESTRFTHHYGSYVAPPYLVRSNAELEGYDEFHASCERNYAEYCTFIDNEVARYTRDHDKAPTGSARKDIYEAAAGMLTMSAETSFVWSTNPMALRKFLKERCHDAADAEIDRFARKLARICFERWPNLFLGADLDDVRRRAYVD